jgi:hypothetical protein
MRLMEIVKQLDTLDLDAIICVQRPWSPVAECIITLPAADFGIPAEVKEAGFMYFLEVHVAHDVLRIFGDNAPTEDERIRILIYYAENDAYPEWVYER